MTNWKELENQIVLAASRYHKLKQKFQSFADNLKYLTSNEVFGKLNISINNEQDKDFFSIGFSGHQILFVFSAIKSPAGALGGVITCYSHVEFPESKNEKIGEFTFDVNGWTSLPASDDGDTANVGDNSGAIRILFEFINIALSLR